MADKKPSKFVKDSEGLARTLGVELFGQRPRRIKQLEALRGIIGTADDPMNGFPARDKKTGIWPRDLVVAWGLERLDVFKGGREFALIPPRVRAAKVELPKQSAPAGDADLFLEQSASERRKGRFDWLENLYLHPESHEKKITQGEIRELREERPWLFSKDSTDTGSENISGGQRGVSNWIRNNYPGVVCNQTDISRWMKGEYLPSGCTENFPAYEDAGRYKTDAVRGWVEKYLVKNTVGQNLPLNLDYRAAQEKLDYERSLEEYRVWQQANSEKFVEINEVERAGAAMGAALRMLTREAIERQFPARLAEKLSTISHQLSTEVLAAIRAMIQTEAVATFTEWQARSVARINELMEEMKPKTTE
jgi:hypothetical protein